MSEKISGVNWNKDSKTKERRKSSLSRLELQLKSGTKPLESARLHKGKRVMQELSDSDIKRINKEIETLKERI